MSMFGAYASASLCCPHRCTERIQCSSDLSMLEYVPSFVFFWNMLMWVLAIQFCRKLRIHFYDIGNLFLERITINFFCVYFLTYAVARMQWLVFKLFIFIYLHLPYLLYQLPYRIFNFIFICKLIQKAHCRQ